VPQYRIDVDRDKAKALGVQIATVANPATTAPRKGAGLAIAAGWMWRRFFTPMRNCALPGRHSTDRQTRLHMSFRQTQVLDWADSADGWDWRSAISP
jgi:hypothetical protein